MQENWMLLTDKLREALLKRDYIKIHSLAYLVNAIGRQLRYSTDATLVQPVMTFFQEMQAPLTRSFRKISKLSKKKKPVKS